MRYRCVLFIMQTTISCQISLNLLVSIRLGSIYTRGIRLKSVTLKSRLDIA